MRIVEDSFSRQTVRCKTEDDWCGNHDGDEVEVSISNITRHMVGIREPVWRVSAWGNDDFGIYKDFGEDQASAEVLYTTIITQPVVNQDMLFGLGMERF